VKKWEDPQRPFLRLGCSQRCEWGRLEESQKLRRPGAVGAAGNEGWIQSHQERMEEGNKWGLLGGNEGGIKPVGAGPLQCLKTPPVCL